MAFSESISRHVGSWIRHGGMACSAAALMLFAAPSLRAEVRLPHILSDHGVLQRNSPIHIWGWAAPGEKVDVAFHGQKQSTAANTYGEWSVYLAPESAGGPFPLTVKGETGSPITYSDMLVGDVWFASGQSNMEMPLKGFDPETRVKNGDAEIAAANQPQIRLLLVERKPAKFPQEDFSATWTQCTPETAKDFSAVAYLFGHEVQKKEHVPIGLIDSTWGGTPVEAWASMDALTADAALMPAFASWAKFAAMQTRLPEIQAAEKREDDAALAASQPKPKHPWHPVPESWEPAQLYNGMVAPATPYGIKGVIWYQGETNSPPERAPLYSRLLSTMILDWRQRWNEGAFPFLYVQISSFNSPAEDWGTLRDQQRRTLSVANTAMAVSLDVGLRDNVHPPDKETVAARLALGAEALAYGKQVEYTGPVYRSMAIEGNKVRLGFDHSAGLNAKGGRLAGFEIAGEDHHYVPAEASIQGQTVFVSSDAVVKPVSVRYGWEGFTPANLYNGAGLPTSTFTTAPSH